jgi:hypothetical protein
MGFGKLNIGLGQINIDPEILLEFIQKMINANKEQRINIVTDNLRLSR